MTRLYMVRHGRAMAGFGEDRDPGLDLQGRLQADVVAQRLSSKGPIPILSSPLKRARETAKPLAQVWKQEPVIEPAVAEIPSPTENLKERAVWLREFMRGSWRDAQADLAAWREGVIETLRAQKEDTVIFSHFIAINVAAGHALSDDRVIVFSPDNCSVTVFDLDDGKLSLVEKGRVTKLTKVN